MEMNFELVTESWNLTNPWLRGYLGEILALELKCVKTWGDVEMCFACKMYVNFERSEDELLWIELCPTKIHMLKG
jgi:hypothetical protein